MPIRFTKLFEPIQVKSLRLKNRIVMPPICTRFSNLDGSVSERMVNYYAERAKGGVGLIICETAVIDSKLGKGLLRCLHIDQDKYVTGLGEIARAVHFYGGKVAIQLIHMGRQIFKTEPLEGRQPVSASNTSFQATHPLTTVYTRELTVEEIEEIVEKFALAARRVQIAGFDAVEFHGANGYLIAQFFSPYINKRKDRYGGDIYGRSRFAVEIVKRARELVGWNYPIIFRIPIHEMVSGGITLEDSKTIAKILEDAGVDILNTSVGLGETYHYVIPPMALPQGCYVEMVGEIKKNVKIPVIAVGRINDPMLAEKILLEEKADLVEMGRALIADPELPKKAKKGRLKDIRRCVGCNECVRHTRPDFPIICTLNPTVGREKECRIVPVRKPRRVLVVGGGPAGMEAATIAALKGHRVILYEKSKRLGGQLNLASTPPHKEELRNVISYFSYQLKKLKVKVVLGKEVNLRTVKRIKPDVIIVATGAVPIIPDIRGVKNKNVVTAWDVLAGRVEVGEEVVIVGGGMVGCETAEYLAEKGRKVTVIEMLPDIAIDMETFSRIFLLERLTQKNVRLITNTKVKEITKNGVIIVNQREEILEADTVVLAVGSKPNTKLLEELEGKFPEVYAVGDCVEPRRCLEAIHEAWNVAFEL